MEPIYNNLHSPFYFLSRVLTASERDSSETCKHSINNPLAKRSIEAREEKLPSEEHLSASNPISIEKGKKRNSCELLNGISSHSSLLPWSFSNRAMIYCLRHRQSVIETFHTKISCEEMFFALANIESHNESFRCVRWDFGHETYFFDTHLIPEHSNAACRWDLIRTEPDGSKFRWQREDEDLGCRHNRLADESYVEQIRMNTQHLHPSTEACAQTSENSRNPQTLEKEKNWNLTMKISFGIKCRSQFASWEGERKVKKTTERVKGSTQAHDSTFMCLRLASLRLSLQTRSIAVQTLTRPHPRTFALNSRWNEQFKFHSDVLGHLPSKRSAASWLKFFSVSPSLHLLTGEDGCWRESNLSWHLKNYKALSFNARTSRIFLFLLPSLSVINSKINAIIARQGKF